MALQQKRHRSPDRHTPGFLSGGGELGALIRAHDWASTPLGDPETWPRTLQAALRVMLASRQPIWIGWGPELTCFYNDPCKSIVGGKHPWALGRPAAEVWRETWPEIGPLIETAMSGDQPAASEVQPLVLEPEGDPEGICYTFTCSSVPHDDDTAGGVICASAGQALSARIEDTAALRQSATHDLRESEARFRNMAEHAPVMMWVTDPEGSLTYLNQLWSEFTGQSPEEALGFGAWMAIHPDDRSTMRDAFRAAIAAQEPFEVEFRLRRYDGTFRWALSAAASRFGGIGGDGPFLGYIGSVIDISDRKEAEHILKRTNEVLEQRVTAAIADRAETEAQLRQAQKMEAVGKLTGGVAHDFNNVLQVIGGNLQLLTRDVTGNLRAEQRLQTAIAAISRGSKLASQLLAFGRRQPLAPKVLSLGRLLRGTDDMLRRALGDGIEIETIIAGGLWNTFVDVAQVENAILNLAINARDAMDGQGKLTIEAGNASLDEVYTARHDEVLPGQYVLLAVSDTGSGMAPEVLERAFEPFFTTKPEGQGTGLGLSMVYGFVKQSGGHVKIYSEPGQGTTVRLYLPRSREEEDVELDYEVGPATGGSETVLVVEDDEDVRGTVIDMLSDLGYRVLKARDAQSALAIVESGIPIDMLFTDVVMPGPLRSPELARKARERMPNIAVLFTSGYTEDAIVHGGRLDEGIDLLSKPYTREVLARKLRHVLRNQQQRRISEQRVAAAAARRREEQVAQQKKARHLRVLLVEDDALIRMSTSEMLMDLGHAVTEAEDSKEALAQLERGRYDVMLTDLSLPGLPGDELAATALTRQPGLGIIFASGYDRVPNRDAALKDATLLQKPYDETALADALKTVTGGGRG
jgi:PAS domain S-box-containing protein